MTRSMRLCFISLLIILTYSTKAQVRFGLQTGINSISEEGLSSQLNTTLSLGWKFENYVSWGLQYSTTLRTKQNGNSKFYHCDSLVQDGWSKMCAGNDSMVNSDFTNTYNMNSIGIYLLKHRRLSNEKFDLAGGIRVNSHFLSRQEERLDALLDYNKTEKAIAASLNPMIRFSYTPYLKKNDFSIFIEGSTGIFISPQWQCDDANCDNFLKQAVNSTTIIQIGISY